MHTIMDGDAQDLFLWPLSASLFEARVGCSLSQQWTNQFYGVGGSARVSFKASGPYKGISPAASFVLRESREPNSSLQDVRVRGLSQKGIQPLPKSPLFSLLVTVVPFPITFAVITVGVWEVWVMTALNSPVTPLVKYLLSP